MAEISMCPERAAFQQHAGAGRIRLRQRHVAAQAKAAQRQWPIYIAGELVEYIEANEMSHVRGAPMHQQTKGKIGRWHQTLKNRIQL